MYNTFKSAIESECNSFNAQLLEFNLNDGKKDSSFQYLDVEIKINISHLKADEFEALEACLKADVITELDNFDNNYAIGDFNIIKVGSPKKSGFWGKIFG